MRDIRSDLQEAGNSRRRSDQNCLIAQFENTIQQLKTERDTKIADLKSGIAMIAKCMEFEERFLANSPPTATSPPVALADLFMGRLNETGQLSKAGASRSGRKRRLFSRRRTRQPGRTSYAGEHVAKRVNSGIARRNSCAADIVPNDQASPGGLVIPPREEEPSAIPWAQNGWRKGPFSR